MSAELVDAINPDQRLLLRAAVMSGAPARDAWREWRERVAFDDVDGPSQRLLPLLARRLEGEVPDDPVWRLIRGIYRHAWVGNQLLLRDARSIVDALRARDVPAVVLKGAAMVRYFGGDWGARPMYDVDILVPLHRLDDSFAVLGATGWAPQLGRTTEWIRWRAVPRRHSWGFDREPDGHFDLHWHVMLGSLGPRADEAFWEAAQPLQLGGTSALALAPPDLLLHLLDHGTRGKVVSPVQWVADATAVLRAEDVDALGVRLAQQARAHGALLRVRACLDAISELVEEPAAAELNARLASARPSRLERLAEMSTDHGRVRKAVHHAARAMRSYGGGPRSSLRGVAGFTRSWLDLALVSHRAFVLLYATLGRSLLLSALGRRMFGTFSRTPIELRSPLQLGAELDFADPAVGDQHAGPGWFWVDDDGLESAGREARILLDVGPARDLELTFQARATGTRPRAVEIAVNERRLARVQLAASATSVRVAVPSRVVRRFLPLEIMFRAPRGSTGKHSTRRPVLGITLRSLRIDAQPAAPPGRRG